MSVSLPSAWRGTHSRATQQPRSKAAGSRRFSFERCRPFIALGCGVVSAGFLANAAQSFATSDDLSMILFGVSSMPFGALCGWFLAPASPKREAEESAELAERTRRWSEAADRMRELKRQYAEAQRRHACTKSILREMQALNRAMLAGEV